MQTDGKVIYIFVNERNTMQSIIHFFKSMGKVFGGHDLDTVDPNLIRFYRTEYGSGWKEELNFHLYNRNQKKGD